MNDPDYITLKADVRIYKDLYDILKEGGVDIPRLLQGFINELNAYYNESKSIYENLKDLETDQVLLRFAQRHREGREKARELKKRAEQREEVLRSRREP